MCARCVLFDERNKNIKAVKNEKDTDKSKKQSADNSVIVSAL
jgi:hypothetical protein